MAFFLVVDKPAGITSHDVVAILRAVTGAKKVGHTGTLDPFATGVLPLALGRATRLIQYLDEDLKIYDAHIALGARTDTGDPTGEVVAEAPVPPLDAAQVEAVLAGFVGTRMQEPPRYSAVKVDGKRLYAYARKGEDVRAQPRPVRIDAVELLSLDGAALRVRITCGRGTYARVLADEIAVALGTVGHLSALRRERSGAFSLDRAIDLAQLAALVSQEPDLDWPAVLRPGRGGRKVPWRSRDQVREALAPWLLPPLGLLSHLPQQVLTPAQTQVLQRSGNTPAPPADVPPGQGYLAVDGDRLIALLKREGDSGRVACMIEPG